jgi:hypothetical protein
MLALVYPVRAPGTDLHAALRLEVGRFRARESRRVFDLSLQVGELGGGRYGVTVPSRDLAGFDASLRTDVAAGLVQRCPEDWGTAWLVRPGTPEQHDLDLQWLAATRTAFGIHGRTLEAFYALTRSGWRDVVSGETRVWKRLRL